jgi:signal transduction histidine kinase
MSSTNIVAARIYSADGRPFATFQRDKRDAVPARLQITPGQQEQSSFAHEHLMLTQAIVFQGKLAGFIFIESDLHTLFARLKTYVLIAVVMLACSLLLALFVSRVTRRAIATPIANLANTARIVSRERKYEIRVPTGNEEGELALLVETFNEMLTQIEERDRSLQSAHDQLESRVEERTAQLAAANQELESFSYSVSHDLRAPLRSIDGFSLALEEDYGDKLDDEAKSHIHRVRAATQRMGVLIDDLLNLSRVTRAEMHRERVDLSEMVRSLAADLERTGEERQVDWVIRGGVETFADTRLLRVVLDNLVGNAWKYSSKHQRACIEFGEELRDGSSIYFVKDDGAGFNPAYSEKLFGAFQRLHGATEFAGTGIGLATVQRIIRRHGGSVWAESAVEKGATFYFTVGASNGGTNGNASHSADRRQSRRRSIDAASVEKEQYQK